MGDTPGFRVFSIYFYFLSIFIICVGVFKIRLTFIFLSFRIVFLKRVGDHYCSP